MKREDRFNNNRATKHEAELHGGKANHRNNGVAQRMLE